MKTETQNPFLNAAAVTKPLILAIGAVPPPAIGPNIAMQRLLQADNLRAAFGVVFLDISDRRAPGNIGTFDFVNIWLEIKHIVQCVVILITKRPSIAYLNVSQGLWGYLRDLGFIIPALLMRRKVVVHLRGSEFGTFYSQMPSPARFLTRAVFKRVARVIVLGESLRSVFRELVDQDSISVVPNGIGYREFDSLREHRTQRTGCRILHVSGLRKRKGVLELIAAIPAIAARCPEIHLTLVGEWQDRNDERDALKLIENYGLQDHVTFTGEVTGVEKLRMYQEHDLFVFTPTEPEGLPWVLLEAMSTGMPVVTSDQGAIREVVLDGKTGFIIEPKPAEIAEKVCYLLDHPQQARAMGLRGRRRVEEHFSEESYLKALEQVFNKALETN